MATAYPQWQPNGYTTEYGQPHPLLPGLDPHQKRISYMSRDQARQHQSFSVQAEPMAFIQAQACSHLIDAQTYQQRAEERKKKHTAKRKSNINQALPRPSYKQAAAGHHHKISNQEPITQFQELNSLKQRHKTGHHQIGSALPSNSNIYSKETHSVASTRNPSFSVQHAAHLVDDIADIAATQMQHNNTRITHTTNLTQMTELTELTDMSINPEDVDDADDVATVQVNDDDDDDATAISINVPHVASLSSELKSFQNELKKFKPNKETVTINKASLKSRTMPKSSLALMSSGMLDSDGNLSKQSILLINRVRDKSIHSAPKLDKILSVDEEEKRKYHHKKIPSDVSGMSSISTNNPYKYRYNRSASAYSVASSEVLTPKPLSTRTPNNKKKRFEFVEEEEEEEEDKSTSNEALTTMNKIKLQQNRIGLEPIESPVADKTPIAFSSKCLYRFVLNDRDKEIAIGDIVKAPIPLQQVHNRRKEMKFNAIVNKTKEVQVITKNKVASHYLGIVRYLGSNSKQNGNGAVTYLGLQLMDPIGDCDGTMLDSETGDYVRPFITQPNYAVFVSAAGVVKITPSILLTTLTDTIQKLNKHIVTLCQHNYVQQKQIHALDQKNAQLAKTEVTSLISPSSVNDNSLKPTTTKNIIVSHQMQPSFASGYGIISGNIQEYKHAHNPSMLSAVSNISTQPQLHGITHINAQNVTEIAPANALLQSPKLGHQPTPEIHRAAADHHTTVKSNMSELELMQSGYILSNAQYAHLAAPRLSPQNSAHSQPVTPPQPVLHQVALEPNIIQSQQYIFMDHSKQFLNPNPLKQIGIASIPASPPKIREITPTPSPQPPPANQAYGSGNIADIVLQSNPDEPQEETRNKVQATTTIRVIDQTKLKHVIKRKSQEAAMREHLALVNRERHQLEAEGSDSSRDPLATPLNELDRIDLAASNSEDEEVEMQNMERADSSEMTQIVMSTGSKPKRRRRSSVLSSHAVPPPNIQTNENVHSPEATPYRIQVTPPVHLHEEVISFAPQLTKEASNPILDTNVVDSDGDTNSVKAEGGDKSPIPPSMQGTPKPTTPYTPYTDGEDEAKLSRPTQIINHFDEERDDDSNNKKVKKYISKSPTINRKKKQLRRKKTITRSSTQNYDHRDPFRAPWEKQSEGNASPVSVSHGTGYDVHLNALIADAADQSSSERSMSLCESSSSDKNDDDDDDSSSSVPTDHELEHDASPTPPEEDKKTSDEDKDTQHLGLFMQLNSLKCSDPIIESQGEEEEEDDDEDEDEDEDAAHVLDVDEIVTVEIDKKDFPLQLEKQDTGEIQLQSYDLGAPPTRHNRQDTAQLHHKKRGTLKDIKSAAAQKEEEEEEEESTEKEYVLLLDAEEEDGLSDMITPQPKEKAVLHSMPPTRFSFVEHLDDNDDNDDNEKEGFGALQIKEITKKYESGEISSITPISKQNYGVAAPPTKHNRDNSTVHDRMRLNVNELNALLKKSPRTDTIIQDVEYSSDDMDDGELMDYQSLQRLEAADSQRPFPGALHLQMSTATREYVEDLGLSVEDNMDEMDLTDEELRGSSPSTSVTPSPQQQQQQQHKAVPLIPNPGLIVNHSVDSIGSVASDKGPVRPQKALHSNYNKHHAARSMSSLNTLHVMNMNIDVTPRSSAASTSSKHGQHLALPSPQIMNKSDDEMSFDDNASQGSILIHDQVENTENVITDSMDIGEDILDELQYEAEMKENGQADDGMITDEDGTDIHKKKGYTKKMKKFVPAIKAADVESMEIMKQIENFKSSTKESEKTPKKKRRKSKKSKRLHQTSPRKVHSPVHQHIYHGAMHSPYDQMIYRPELDNNASAGQSSRHYSVKSKRSSNRSSDSSQRRGSKRNSKSSSRNSKSSSRERRKSKQKRGSKSRNKKKSKRRHHHKNRSSSADDSYDGQQADDDQQAEAQNISNGMQQFYPQPFYQQQHFQSHSVPHLTQVIAPHQTQQFISQQQINYNQANAHQTSMSHGAIDFHAIQNNMFQPQQYHPQYHHHHHTNTSQQW